MWFLLSCPFSLPRLLWFASIVSKKPGHDIDRCYKLHGFPPNFKTNRPLGPKRSSAHVELEYFAMLGTSHTPVGKAEQSGSQNFSIVPGVTKYQYFQLMMLLQQQARVFASPPSSNLVASANFAGMLLLQKEVLWSLYVE